MNYEYKCEHCGKILIINRSIEDRNKLPVCAGCGREMHRTFRGTSFFFKGGPPTPKY